MIKGTLILILLVMASFISFEGIFASNDIEKKELFDKPKDSSYLILAEADQKGDPAKGKEIFETNCAACHGPEGKGDGPAAAALEPKPRNLGDAEYVSTLSNEHLFKVINVGGASVGLSPIMAAWGGILSENEIWNVIAYLRKDICKCEYKGK
ncbi:MAG: c-type cytochrome [Thermodesulfobacteriota bacterium]